MKRDMGLIRDILEMLVSSLEYQEGIIITDPKLDDKWTIDDYNHHIYLCGRAGLLEVEEIDPELLMGASNEDHGDYFIKGITWMGYDLLEKLQNEQDDYEPSRNPIGFSKQSTGGDR